LLPLPSSRALTRVALAFVRVHGLANNEGITSCVSWKSDRKQKAIHVILYASAISNLILAQHRCGDCII
jgi:hypothetical protein